MRPETADVSGIESSFRMKAERRSLLLLRKTIFNPKPDQKYANFCTQKNAVYI